MATPRLASIVLRPSRLVIVCALACLVASAAGCKHKRQSLRPVYVGPGVPAGSSTVIVDDPVPSITPPSVDSSDVDPILTPARPQSDPGVSRSRGVAPPASGAGDEPGLQLPRNPDTGAERTPKAEITPPVLIGPNASRGVPRRASVSRSRIARLQENVRPFVNDPDDLFQPPKADRPWKYVVVHHSANPEGSYDEIDREHRKIQGWDGCGYHFVIGNGTGSPDGQIEVARRWSNQKHGLHCRNGKNPDVNEYGVGICLIGDLDKKPPTPKQVAAARALVAYLAERYEIAGDSVGTHGELASSPTACPGKHFPEEQIFGSKHLAAK